MPENARLRIFKDPASATTHFVGFLAALVAAALLVRFAAPDPPRVVAMAIYGAALVTLFGASSFYHFFDVGERGNRWLRRFDHAAIFLLIAGTAVPPLLLLLDGAPRTAFLAAVAVLAVAGVVFKLAWIDCPGWLSVALYLAMGWLALVPARWIVPQLSGGSLAWLAAGGAAYTLGALVYARRWPDPWPDRFGHHEVWHCFVLAGAAAHYAFTWTLLDVPLPPL
jgi:hemolysin III